MTKEMPSQTELKKLFRYDKKTGKLYNRLNRGRARKGQEAGFLSARTENLKYRKVGTRSRYFPVHRIIWVMFYNYISSQLVIDHIDGNGLNNRIDNLRLVNHKENLKNQSLYRNNKSNFCGVSWNKKLNKWYSDIRKNRRTIYLGVFKYKWAAIRARIRANLKYGFHSNHGRTKK